MRLLKPILICICIVVIFYCETGFSWASEWPMLMPIFEEASINCNLPLPLLLTLGYFGSGFENRSDKATIEGGYGVTALRSNSYPNGYSLLLGSTLTNVSEDTIKTDPRANIMACAAVMDQYAKDAAIDRSQGLGVWLDPVIKYAALDDENSRFFAMQVFKKLQSGLSVVTTSGEKFEFVPQQIAGTNIQLLAPTGMVKAAGSLAETQAIVTPDYPGAIWDPAAECNFSTYQDPKDTVIIHIAEGTAAGTRAWFKNCDAQCSSQYVVAEDGTVWQMVQEKYRAWHVLCYNSRSIGIEHEGYTASASHPQTMYDASAKLTRNICERWGIPKEKHTVGPGVLGHIDVTNCCCGDHTDPGTGWNWSYYMLRVASDPATISGTVTNSADNSTLAGVSLTIIGGAAVTTDVNGIYTFADLAPGTYTISISKTGFTATSATVIVASGEAKVEDITLNPINSGEPGIPVNPTAATETHGVINGMWQSAVSKPTFTWTGASSNSGIAGYYVYLGIDPNGTSTKYVISSTYTPYSLSTGTYYLRLLVKDVAGNTAAGWATLFTFKYDSSAPSVPIIVDDGPYSGSKSVLHASWSSTDPSSGVSQYMYAIGSSLGGSDIVGWTSASMTDNFKIRIPVELSGGTKYYISAKAKNGAGLWSAVGSSDGITAIDASPTVSAVKSLADGQAVALTNKNVSACFADYYYIEDSDRISGIRIAGPGPTVGSIVTVGGIMGLTSDNERVILSPATIVESYAGN